MIWRSFSDDRGLTWSAGEATTIADAGSRFFIRALPDGDWLLINSPDPTRRTGILARLSSDEGATWHGHLMLDDRDFVSYPDAAFAADSTIYAVHDRERGAYGLSGPGEILLSVFRKEENYMFAASPDERTWTPHEYRPHVVNGTNSKPIFECFAGVYYLGWNEAMQVNSAYRSVFNLDVSRDGIHWERKYRFETDKSFQYPTLREYAGAIYLTVTQGDHSESRKERIMFGKL